MKILGAGLSRTGTLSLHKALQILGFNSVHWEPSRLNDVIKGVGSDFKRYDDVDAVSDIPAAFFFREIFGAYPNCKVILTIRDMDSWFESVKYHYQKAVPANLVDQPQMLEEAKMLQKMVYGSEEAIEDLYKQRFKEHNQAVIDYLSPERLLVMNIIDGDGWSKLCPFLNLAEPKDTFPCLNVR
jgi:glutaredoxin-related protein